MLTKKEMAERLANEDLRWFKSGEGVIVDATDHRATILEASGCWAEIKRAEAIAYFAGIENRERAAVPTIAENVADKDEAKGRGKPARPKPVGNAKPGPAAGEPQL